MGPKTAQIIFAGFNLLAIPAVLYAAYDYWRVLAAINRNAIAIPLDTGLYYLFLMSVFWILSGIQWAGLKMKKTGSKAKMVAETPTAHKKNNAIAAFIWSWAGYILIGWFLLCLVMANAVPLHAAHLLKQAGYVPCKNPDAVSRVSRGESLIYQKKPCSPE